MRALLYSSPNTVSLRTVPKPNLQSPTDALIKLTTTTICGTDLHIKGGDVATCSSGTILGHEGIGIIEELGAGVTGFKKGERVLISCICSCAKCEACRKGMWSHCESGGWVLGNTINGTQAEYVRIPHATTSLYPLPSTAPSSLVLLSDIFPTGLECGVLNGRVSPGSTVVIVGAGPVGLAALLTSLLYSPSILILIDLSPHRLSFASSLGATHTITAPSANENADSVIEQVMSITGGKGADTVIEAVGVPETFELCQSLVAVGGTIANVGVHGKSVGLHLESLWDKNITITTKLVDTTTTPMLLKLALAGKLDPAKLITHKFKFEDMEKAYETFAAASESKALKILIEF
jgi:alcohol dehydrogenase